MATRTKKLAGVHYVERDERTKTGKRKRGKPTLAELKGRQALSDRIHAESTRIREQAGKEPLPPTFWRVALDAEIASRSETKRQRAPKRARTLADKLPSLATVENYAAQHGFQLVPVAEGAAA